VQSLAFLFTDIEGSTRLLEELGPGYVEALAKHRRIVREAYVRHGGVEAHVPAFACEPKDLTGAGDMFAGAFLYGITHGVPPDRAARAGCFLAMKVISQVGARLHHGARHFWDHALAAA
jgi:sugar/nucleoside kinase (ribokinase family)